MSGRFKPGQSGNPGGRPKDKTPATLLRKYITRSMPEILEVLVNAAKNGDIAAAKVLLDRTCPPLKPAAAPVTLLDGHNLVERGDTIIQATLDGELAPDVGATLIKMLTDQSGLIKIEELTERIERLEQCLKSASKK